MKESEVLTEDYEQNIAKVDTVLSPGMNYDLVKRTLRVGEASLTLYYLEGMTKTDSLEKLIVHFCTVKDFGAGNDGDARTFAERSLPAADTLVLSDIKALVSAVLGGSTLLFCDGFGAHAVRIDLRSYPARPSEEPENDKVMRGSRDGFVETLITNVSLIRRRIKNPDLVVRRVTAGKSTGTDLALCYMKGRADEEYAKELEERLASLDTDSLVLGHESMAEALMRKQWYNPFPKSRATERPDAAAATILEGGIIVLCDNSPEAMIFPTTLFHFLQETDDFYFSPLTGTYLRLLRHCIFWLTMILTPLWYLAMHHGELLPPALHFVIPSDPGDLPILAQIILTEFALDGLKLASLNTPNVLASSLSVVGGLLLGDFAVTVGWVSPDVILYMAFVSIANFTQSSYELGYAFKYLRIVTLILTALFDWIGFALGILLGFVLAATNRTLDGRHCYLYPLIPWNGHDMARLVFRLKKDD